MRSCQACGAASPDDQRFCGDCGAPLVAGCASCGAANPAGQRFCGSCGQLLATTDPALPVTAMVSDAMVERVAERRVCSVLFCDLVGFTPLSEARDPEEVRELLSRYFDTARTVIGRYGGVVEKFIGDAVMAVWGTPVATEGDGERAVRAGLDLVEAVAQIGNEVSAPGLAARVGVVTGEVAVTLGATNEGMVAGDAVNTAARVQAVASAGLVLVDASTHRLSESAIGFDDAGEHILKGKSAPEHLFRANRVLSGVGGVQRVDGLEARLTGRDAELRMVKELFHASIDRRQPRLVVVSGPAGVGKSRLGWEFEKYIDGLATSMLWHRGRCLSYGDGVAFWALAEIVKQRLGIAEDEPVDVASVKLADGVADIVSDPAERTYVGVRLARLLGVPFAGDSGAVLAREELFAGWRLFIERLAALGPVLMLVEDAQHADAGLLDFLDHLIDWSRDLPLCVLVFTRPELEQTRPGFGVGRNRSLLALDPLDSVAMDSLVDQLVPDLLPEVRAAITNRSQGLPLFAVETIRSLIDRDIVVPRDGHYRLVGEIGELAVPDSLHALLAARLDALEAGVRALVADAAVLGSTFPAQALAAVSGRDEGAVRTDLDELLRREVFDVSADPLSPDQGTYGFAQEMLRRVAYDTLSRRDRKAKHLVVAAHLRATFPNDGDEVMDVVAQHYLDALTAVPTDPDVDGIRDDAVAALVRAAERAVRTGSQARAATSYTAAAELVTGLGTAGLVAASLWERAAVAANQSGDLSSAVAHAERARDGYTRGGRPRAAAIAQTEMGRALRRAGRHSDARTQLLAALAVLRKDPDAATVSAVSQLASLETFAGAADADRLTTECLELAQALAVDASTLADVFIGRGNWLTFSARRAEAAACYREAARLAEQIGDTSLVGEAVVNLSDALATDDPSSAAEAARAAAGYLRQCGNQFLLVTALCNLVIALVAIGRWDEAEEVLAEAVETDGLDDDYLGNCAAWLSALRGDTEVVGELLAGLHRLRASEDPQERAELGMAEAFAAAANKQPELVLRHAQTVLKHAEVIGISADYPRWVWPLAARAALELDDTDGTRDLLAILDGYQPGQLAPMLRAERDLVRARLAADHGNTDATELFAAAINRLRELSTPYHLAHGLLDYAEHLAASDHAAAAAAVAEAREIAQELRCRPLLDRADQIGASAPVAVG